MSSAMRESSTKKELATLRRQLQASEVALAIANRSLVAERAALEEMRMHQRELFGELEATRRKNEKTEAEINSIRLELAERAPLYELLADAKRLVERLNAELKDARAENVRLRGGA